MGLLAILVEGLSEKIFFRYLLYQLQTQYNIFFSKKLTNVLKNNTNENKIWLVNCGGDGSFVSYIKNNKAAFLKTDFEYLIVIRDYHPHNKPNLRLCKKDLCNRLIENIPSEVIEKYNDNIFINLSVQSFEAWFFADKELFQRMYSDLTVEFINTNLNNILNKDPENFHNPKREFEKIINLINPDFRFKKHEDEIYHIVSRINMENCLNSISNSNIQSLYRIVNFLYQILIN